MINLYLQKLSSIKTILFLLFIVPFILLSCSGGKNNGGGGSNGTTLQSISVYSPNSILHLNTTGQIIATGIYSNGTTKDISTLVTWNSSNSNVLSVGITANNQGIVSAITAGSNIVITATLNGVSGSTIISSSASPLQSITIINSVLIAHVGVNVQLTAIGIYSDGSQNITNNASWNSSLVNIATITSGNNAGGLVNPLAAGTTTITASFSGQSASINLTVSAAALSSISLSPSNSTTHLGINQQLTATAVFADSLTQDITAFASWSSSASSIATITSGVTTGGLAVPVSAGSTTITATLNNISGSTNLTVSNSTLQSITLNLSLSSHLHKKSKLGVSTATTHLGVNQQFTVTAVFNDGTTQNVTASAIWSSSNLSIANVSNASGTQGLVVPIAPGATVISASLLGQTGSVNLTVSSATLQSIAITPGSASVALGITQQYLATATFADGTQTISNSVIWLSSNQSIANVSSTGLAYTNAIGSANISAVLNGVTSNNSTLRVTAAVLSTIGVSPVSSTLPIGTQQQFIANGIFSNGIVQNLTSSVAWSSSNTSIATINSSGLATAIAVGSSTITASYAGISSSATITVPSAVLQSITITPVIGNTLVGNNQQLIANGVFSDGSIQNLSSTVTWASSNSTILSVNSTGFMNIVKDGSATITASLGSISGTMTPNVISYVYAANQTGPISMYSVNSANGQLTALSPATVAAINPLQLTIANVSSGSYLYTSNNSANNISMFSINPANGQLTPLSPATIATGASPRAIAVANTSSGSYAYVANGTGATVSMYSINSATGQLTALSPATIAVAAQPSGAAVATTALGTFLYISSQSASNNVSMFSINTANGQLTALSPATVSAGSSAFSIAVTPSGDYAYTANTGTQDSSMFRIQPNGQLTPLAPPSIATVSSPVVVTVSPSGNSVYIGCQSNFVSSYSLDPASGLLTSLGNIPGGSTTSGVTVTPSGNYAYAGNQSSNTVSMYSISSNGALTPIGSIPAVFNTFGVASR